MKTLVILLDGAPEPENSALQKAHMPVLDALAKKSMCGIWPGPKAPDGYNIKSLSELGMLAILGYSPADSPGRGYVEALELGVDPQPGAVYLRTNFSTVDENLRIIDRRGGRDESFLEELAQDLNTEIEGITIRLIKGRNHRGLVILEGPGLSSKISDVDVGQEKPARVEALEPEAALTARVLNTYLNWSHEKMKNHEVNTKRQFPANYLLMRSPGMQRPIQSFKERYGMECGVVGDDTIFNGISRYVGMEVISSGGAQEIETNLEERIDMALELLKRKDMVFLHIKGTDAHAHYKNFPGKIKFLEEIDRKMLSRIPEDIGVVIISDHATSSVTGEHTLGNIPVLIYNGKDTNNVETFDEVSCEKGFLEDHPMEKIMSLLR